MSIHDFYSRFMASDERTPLFQALHALSRIPNVQAATTTTTKEESALRDWAIWNENPTGTPSPAGA
ncbi:MAG TPA: hypothetical protein VHU81_09160 [Thermoanaerobaculia bacterium]|jgi:hypothetical protein|nr:hypothetical protein [Thermoanaerobaculia bacterium]